MTIQVRVPLSRKTTDCRLSYIRVADFPAPWPFLSCQVVQHSLGVSGTGWILFAAPEIPETSLPVIFKLPVRPLFDERRESWKMEKRPFLTEVQKWPFPAKNRGRSGSFRQQRGRDSNFKYCGAICFIQLYTVPYYHLPLKWRPDGLFGFTNISERPLLSWIDHFKCYTKLKYYLEFTSTSPTFHTKIMESICIIPTSSVFPWTRTSNGSQHLKTTQMCHSQSHYNVPG